MAHAHPGDTIDLRPLGPRLVETPSRALLRTQDLELLHVVLMNGDTVPPHAIDAARTIHVLEGRILLGLGGAQQALQAGELVLVEAGTSHTIEALADASLLVTLLLPHGGSASAVPKKRRR